MNNRSVCWLKKNDKNDEEEMEKEKKYGYISGYKIKKDCESMF